MAGIYVPRINSQRLQSKIWRAPSQARRRVPAPLALSLGLDPVNSANRQELEAFIAQKFERQHSAQIHQFLPYLLTLRDSDQLAAVVGLRPALDGELFLERYLDDPIEQAISQAFWTPVDSDRIVEIGNLAATTPESACMLFAILANVLHRAGLRWVVCTATPQVKSMLDKLQFPSRTICNADSTRLVDDASQWGDYYATRPQVIVGDSEAAAYRVASDRALSALTYRLAQPIRQTAATLRTRV